MTDCRAAQEVLEEHRRGELDPARAQAVEAHLAGCPACRRLREADLALASTLRSLPGTPAPPTLRRRLHGLARQHRRGARFGRRPGRWLAAAAILLMAALGGAWLLRPRDTVDALVASGVAEHRRILLQVQGTPGGVTDPGEAFTTVRATTDVQLPPVLAGDEHLRLLVARPTLVAERKAATATLRYDRSGSVTTYFALPGRDLPAPAERRRVQIEQYRPYMRRVNSFHVIYWKQGELAYLMVTDLDDAQARKLFLKMRKAL